jgi:hypothetical protein
MGYPTQSIQVLNTFVYLPINGHDVDEKAAEINFHSANAKKKVKCAAVGGRFVRRTSRRAVCRFRPTYCAD